MAARSAATRLRRDSSRRRGFLLTPWRLRWFQTNSSGLSSGAYPGRKCSSRRPRRLWTYCATALAMCAGWRSSTRNTRIVPPPPMDPVDSLGEHETRDRETVGSGYVPHIHENDIPRLARQLDDLNDRAL